MIIDGVASSEAIDSSGEQVLLSGLDDSDLKEGKCYINFEHQSQAEDLCGLVTYSKKIFSENDCETDRQKMFWDQTKLPFLYIQARLFDEDGHIGAICLAAILRAFKSRNEKIQLGFSVEGSTLERDGNLLKRTVIRKISATIRPCNKQAWADIIQDVPEATIFKNENLSHSYNFTTVDTAIVEDPIQELKQSVIQLQKTLTAGVANVAPSELTGGAALTVSSIDRTTKNKIKAALRDWNRTRPLKETIKAALPEVSDEYIDHFTHIAEDLSLKKGMSATLSRVTHKHSLHPLDNEDQKQLIEGIYLDKQLDQSSPAKAIRKRNDQAKEVIISRGLHGADNGHRNASAYYAIAKDVFGMGDHVPVTTHFSHSHVFGGMPAQATEYRPGSRSLLESSELRNKTMSNSAANGDLHKLAMVDSILGNSNRSIASQMVDPTGKVLNIDNHKAFSYDETLPGYTNPSESGLWAGMHDHTPHIDAAQWIKSVKPKELVQKMAAYGFDQGKITKALRRLKVFQAMADNGLTFRQVADNIKLMENHQNESLNS